MWKNFQLRTEGIQKGNAKGKSILYTIGTINTIDTIDTIGTIGTIGTIATTATPYINVRAKKRIMPFIENHSSHPIVVPIDYLQKKEAIYPKKKQENYD